jgi:hypothetical protein
VKFYRVGIYENSMLEYGLNVFTIMQMEGCYERIFLVCKYQKNPNPDYFQDGRIKKGTEYIQIDMEVIMNSLQPGQTCEISNSYVGMTDKVPTRVIVHQLTKEQQKNDYKIKL